MNAPSNADRPTETWKLWAIGVGGGVVLAFLMFYASGDDAQSTSRSATQVGVWSIRLLIAAALLGGGWAAMRKSK